MRVFEGHRLLVLILCMAPVFAGTLAASRRLSDSGAAEGGAASPWEGPKAVTERAAAVAAPERAAREDAPAAAPAGQQPQQEAAAVAAIQVDRSVIAGGGGRSSGANAGNTYTVEGTVGQLVAADTQGVGQSAQSGGQFTVSSGFWNTLPATTTTAPAVPTFQFEVDTYAASEGVSAVNVRVLRLGPAVASAVEIVSQDATARQKGDYTLVVGRLSFAASETEKTIQVLVNDDAYAEGFEFATLLLQHPENGVLGAPNAATLQITDNAPEATSNPIDDARTFVGTHYHDFLYRQADQSGEDFWTQQIEACGADAQCRAVRRVAVSTAFFLSIEFQQTGYLVIRAYKAAFGNSKSNPRYDRFLSDQRQVGNGLIVGAPGWEQKLADNRRAYLEEFVSRAEFLAQFPQGQPAGDYVDKLFQNAGATPPAAERDAAITAYGAGDTAGRAAALASVVESGSVFNRLYNEAFVLMQFYGYLRRNPDDAPDLNFAGYDFWLAKMNQFSLPGEDMRNPDQAHARVRRAEMVRAFVESLEYRQRFAGAPEGNQLGPPVSAQPGP